MLLAHFVELHLSTVLRPNVLIEDSEPIDLINVAFGPSVHHLNECPYALDHVESGSSSSDCASESVSTLPTFMPNRLEDNVEGHCRETQALAEQLTIAQLRGARERCWHQWYQVPDRMAGQNALWELR